MGFEHMRGKTYRQLFIYNNDVYTPHQVSGGIINTRGKLGYTRVLGYCSGIAWVLLEYCLGIAWLLLGYCLGIAWVLLGYSLGIAWVLVSHFSITDYLVYCS